MVVRTDGYARSSGNAGRAQQLALGRLHEDILLCLHTLRIRPSAHVLLASKAALTGLLLEAAARIRIHVKVDVCTRSIGRLRPTYADRATLRSSNAASKCQRIQTLHAVHRILLFCILVMVPQPLYTF